MEKESTFVCQDVNCPHNLWYSGVTKANLPNHKQFAINITPKAEQIHGCMLREYLGDQRWSLEEIGQIWGLSRERIRQIEERALEKIRLQPNHDLELHHQEGIHTTEWRTRTIRVLSGKYIQADGIMQGRGKIYRGEW